MLISVCSKLKIIDLLTLILYSIRYKSKSRVVSSLTASTHKICLKASCKSNLEAMVIKSRRISECSGFFFHSNDHTDDYGDICGIISLISTSFRLSQLGFHI